MKRTGSELWNLVSREHFSGEMVSNEMQSLQCLRIIT
jgi:hypothetical protein